MLCLATISVLGRSMRAGAAPFDGGYFTRLGNPRYYTEGGEPPGQWYGAGAEALGLVGPVDAQEFAAILDGKRRDGTAILAPPTSARAKGGGPPSLTKPAKVVVPGIDLCFSCPKSVSVMWAVADEAQRRKIELAFDLAVKSTLDWLATHVPLVRRGKRGRQRQLAQLVIALFDHGTSRVARGGSWEPQLHRHCVIAAPACGEDGRWTRLDSRQLHAWTRTLGPLFRASLARELTLALGLALDQPTDAAGNRATSFEVAGNLRPLCDHWSSRGKEVLATLAGDGFLGVAATAQARAAANLLSRSAKRQIPPRGELFAQWRGVAQHFGVTPASLAALSRSVAPAIDREEVFQGAWQRTMRQLDAQQSTFTYREALQRLCEAAQASGLADGPWWAERLAEQLTQEREVRDLGPVAGERRYVTHTMWRTEQQLLATLEELREAPGARVTAAQVTATLAAHPQLLAEQRQAVEQLLRDRSRLRVLVGVAGAGKSTTLNVVRAGFERAGYRVLGGAVAGIAKEELATKANLPSRTVASYLYHLEKSRTKQVMDRVRHDAKQILRAALGKRTFQPFRLGLDKKSVLILDEAGMVDTDTLERLTRAVHARGATLLLTGDAKQLQPIAAGGPLLHLLGKQSAARLTENLRQQDPEDRRAVEQFRRGDAAAALANFARRGRLTIATDRSEALRSLVATWRDNGGAVEPGRHAILTATRAEAAAANRLAQQARDAVGQLDRHASLRHGDGVLYRGDRVLFHKNVFADGVRNGYRGEITKVDRFRGKVTVVLDGEARGEVTIRLRDYGPDGITLGYAATTHKSQGTTVDHAYLLQGGAMADREMAYVQATRARLTTHLFVDEAHAGGDLQDLAAALARSRQKQLAVDVAARANDPRPAPHLGR